MSAHNPSDAHNNKAISRRWSLATGHNSLVLEALLAYDRHNYQKTARTMQELEAQKTNGEVSQKNVAGVFKGNREAVERREFCRLLRKRALERRAYGNELMGGSMGIPNNSTPLQTTPKTAFSAQKSTNEKQHTTDETTNDKEDPNTFPECISNNSVEVALPLKGLKSTPVLSNYDLPWLKSKPMDFFDKWVRGFAGYDPKTFDLTSVAFFYAMSPSFTTGCDLTLIHAHRKQTRVFAHVLHMCQQRLQNQHFDPWVEYIAHPGFSGDKPGPDLYKEFESTHHKHLTFEENEYVKVVSPFIYELLTVLTGFIKFYEVGGIMDESDSKRWLLRIEKKVAYSNAITVQAFISDHVLISSKRIRAMNILLEGQDIRRYANRKDRDEPWTRMLLRLLNKVGIPIHVDNATRLMSLDVHHFYMNCVSIVPWFNVTRKFYETIFDYRTVAAITVTMAASCFISLMGPWHGVGDRGTMNFFISRCLKNNQLRLLNCTAMRRFVRNCERSFEVMNVEIPRDLEEFVKNAGETRTSGVTGVLTRWASVPLRTDSLSPWQESDVSSSAKEKGLQCDNLNEHQSSTTSTGTLTSSCRDNLFVEEKNLSQAKWRSEPHPMVKNGQVVLVLENDDSGELTPLVAPLNGLVPGFMPNGAHTVEFLYRLGRKGDPCKCPRSMAVKMLQPSIIRSGQIPLWSEVKKAIDSVPFSSTADWSLSDY